MTIRQLTSACWEAGQDGTHWASETEARENNPGLAAVPVPGPCAVADCDDCQETCTDEEEGNIIHFGPGDDVAAQIAYDGWVTLDDGTVYCPWCREERGLAEPDPPSPGEQEDGGQLRLPGVA